MGVSFLGEQTRKFIEAARQRPEIGRITTTLLASIPQHYLNVDQDKVLKQGEIINKDLNANQQHPNRKHH